MNYDEAIDLIKKIDLEATEIIATDEEINFICNTLETAKKEHELLGLKDQMIMIYRDHINFLLYGSHHGKPLDVRTICDIVTKISELERELE